MSAQSGSVVIGDHIAGSAALVSTLSVFTEYQFHDLVGTIAGLMAISYYLYLFWKWIRNRG